MYFNKYNIQTNYSKSQIVEKLKTLTYSDKIPLFRFNFTEKVFHGKINDDTFSIAQVIKGRNSFIPKINGQIISGNKNVIIIKMRLHYITILIIAFFTLLITWYQLKNFEIGGVIFLLLIYGMTLYFYINECKKVKNIFEENFE